MLHRNYIHIQEFEASTLKNEYVYLYKKDDEIKGENITDKNEGINDYSNNFLNCKNFSQRS